MLGYLSSLPPYYYFFDPSQCCTWGILWLYNLIRRWVSSIFLVWSLAGHGEQDGCAYVLSS